MKAVLISTINLLVATLMLISVWNVNLVLPISLASYMVGNQVVTLLYDVNDYVNYRYLIKYGKKLYSRHSRTTGEMD
jgi:hypothetical protein